MTIKKKADYLDDYDMIRTPEGKKKLSYRGDIYQCPVSDSEWKRYRRLILAISFAYVLFWSLATLSDPSSLRGSGARYVIFPYAALCFPGAFCLIRSIRLQQLSQRGMERIDYDQCFTSLHLHTTLMAAFGFLAGLAQLIYAVVSRSFAPGEWIAAFCFLFIGVLACLSRRLQDQHPCKNTGKAPQIPPAGAS